MSQPASVQVPKVHPFPSSYSSYTLTYCFSSPPSPALSRFHGSSCRCAQPIGDFTPATVPQVILAKLIKDNTLYADVLNAGPMAGTGLTPQQAIDRGSSKNHWSFRVLIDFAEGDNQKTWQIQFDMQLNSLPSIGSNEGQYAGSSRSDPESNEVFSDVGSLNKPPALGSEGGIAVALPAADTGGNGNHDIQTPVYSDVGSFNIPPTVTSNDGGVIQQPTEGAPFPGFLNIKVRDRSAPSNSTLVVFEFKLATGITFGQLLSALTDCHMEPFHFRKLGVAYLGCRDFMCVLFPASPLLPLP